MESRSKLPREIDDKDITRGKVFSVPIPFNDGRPFDFVKYDNDTDTYKVVTLEDGFEGKIDPVSKRKKSEIVKLAINYKLRPALVIQNNYDNQNENYNSVIVLPIETIKEKQKGNSRIKRMMETNDVDNVHYIGNDSYIIINNPVKVHKNMLFENKKNIIFNESVMELIMKKFAKCVDIDKIEKCDECMYNYENYISTLEEVAMTKEKNA